MGEIDLQALFYRNPAPLSAAEHAGRGLNRRLNFSFASRLNALPIGVAEVPLAALWYPIVFTTGEQPKLVAVVGLRDDENLFVQPDGAWLKGAYVPAVVRRYPFILAEEGSQLTLCVDDHPEVLVPGGAPLFEGVQPTPLVEGAFDFCRSVLAGEKATRPFIKALQRLDLLEERTVEAAIAGRKNLQLTGFSTINEAGFRRLRDGDFLDLRQRGWLQAVYGQLQSTLNWARLGELDEARLLAAV